MDLFSQTVEKCSKTSYQHWKSQSWKSKEGGVSVFLLFHFLLKFILLFSQMIVSKLIDLRDAFENARDLLKLMGQSSLVEIEPDSQSLLLDATVLIPGVLSAGIPGLTLFLTSISILLIFYFLCFDRSWWT
jgi:phosphomevalonate kinase